MSLINQIESISHSQTDFGFSFSGVFLKLFTFLKKFDSIFLVSLFMVFFSRRASIADHLAHKEIMEKSTGNEMLDLYYGEGMKLFSQGPYSKNIKTKEIGEEL